MSAIILRMMMRGLRGGALALVLCMLPPVAMGQTTVRYVHTDALGSVVAMTDAAGQVTEARREYEPYGYQTTPAIEDGPGYTGHVQDVATGLTYMQQRYYDPMIGRFLSVDPVTATSVGGNFNRYWYANNNPYKFTDPDGRWAFLAPAGAAAGRCAMNAPCRAAATAATKKTVTRVGVFISGLLGASEGMRQNNEVADSPSDPGATEAGGAFPDRPLPRGEHGEPLPDADAQGPHTQLGRKEGRNGDYPQAREFDGDGNPVRDIDFTDHGRPGEHTNPHQHPYQENPTGGTRQRGAPEPIPPPDPK